jgi:spoIIIJ-associated protein
MKAVESEGTNVEQAIERALILLDLTREQVTVEVMQDPAAGASGNAVVRVMPKGAKPATPAAKQTVSRETPRRDSPAPLAPAPREESGDSTEEGELARSVLAELLSQMGLSCRVGAPDLEDDGQRVLIAVSGEDAALVIGRQGQTLDAIELVLNRIVDRRMPGARQITVDAESYRDRRAQKLADAAIHEAEQVRRTGRPVALEPMTPRDRRSVHLALRDEVGVTTHSEGEGQYRHIVIEPARPLGTTAPRARSL